jgi:transcriptional regulator with XRE-family HTH domain
MKFGDYLRQCREKQKWTQPEAASKIEIEQSYLSKMETGKAHPSEEVFNKLVDVYQFNVNELYEKVSSDELNKLKDIQLVREAILNRNRAKVKTTRSWLIAGFIMLSLGGAFFAASIIPIRSGEQYTYRSDGELKLDEELSSYDLIQKDQLDLNDNKQLIEKRKDLLSRLAYMDEVSGRYKGEAYVKKTLKGRRFFKLINKDGNDRNFTNRWFMVPALMFILGGFSSFFISRRWN